MNRRTANITFASRELTKRETVKVKDSSALNVIAEIFTNPDVSRVTIEPDFYVQLAVHFDEPVDDKTDFETLVIADKNGTLYSTSSPSATQAFIDIFTDMYGEEFTVSFIEKPSKNRQGKSFLTCTLD